MSDPSATAIAWIGDPAAPERGRWGSPAELTVPLDERGLLLADGLFETLLVEEGRIQLLAEHLTRWQAGAAVLALPPPPPAGLLEPLVADAVSRSGIHTGALRLNGSRGSGGAARGLDLPPAGTTAPRFWLQLTASRPCFAPLSAWISRHERRNPASRLSQCKSFAYGAQIQARREAHEAGADEALLLAAGSGELSCGAAANLLLRRGGQWLTPPLSSGCLPGVMRGRALRLGIARESRLMPEALAQGEAAVLINSLGCRPITQLEGQSLPALGSAAAEALWRGLLESGAPS